MKRPRRDRPRRNTRADLAAAKNHIAMLQQIISALVARSGGKVLLTKDELSQLDGERVEFQLTPLGDASIRIPSRERRIIVPH